MARPAMRDPQGRWSLSQVAAAAGVTYRTARTVAASGYLDANRLTHRDIPLLRTVAALLDAPRPAGLTRTAAADQATRRNQEALKLVRGVIADPHPSDETTLVVLPTAAHLTTKAVALMGLIDESHGLPLLLLPIGTWVNEARDIVNHPPTHQEAV